jgi:hypothetical protein
VLVLAHGLWLCVVALQTGLLGRILAPLVSAFWTSTDWAVLAVPMIAAVALLAGWSLLALTVAGGRRAALVAALAINAAACGLALADAWDPFAGVAVMTSACMVGALVQTLRLAPRAQ